MNFVKRLFWGQYRFYSISTSILFVWMFILDSNDLTVQYRLWSELSEMKAEKAFYQQKIKELEKEKRMVIGNPALLEKYAREKYLMKKPKQDIFVIVDEKKPFISKGFFYILISLLEIAAFSAGLPFQILQGSVFCLVRFAPIAINVPSPIIVWSRMVAFTPIKL